MEKNRGIGNEGYLNENYRYFHLKDTAGQERDFHYHSFDKLVLLISGNVEYMVEGRSYYLQPWDVLPVRRRAIHKAIIDVTQPYERVIIYLRSSYFEQLFPGSGLTRFLERSGSGEGFLLRGGREAEKLLRPALENYEKALADTGKCSDALRDSCMIQILVAVNRLSGRTDTSHAPKYDPKIRSTLDYIENRPAQELTVDMLAERVYLSRYHFMRLFKQETGETVHSYIRQRRLMLASKLIREGMNASEAALECGFRDYSTFYRAFRETFGSNPSDLLGR